MMGEGEYYQNLVLTNDAGDTFITTNRGATWTVITEENTTPDNNRRIYNFSALTKTCGVLAFVAWRITGNDWLIGLGLLFLIGAWYILDFYYWQQSAH